MENTEKLLSENKMQELCELQGRTYAAIEYIRSVNFPEREILLAMLGAKEEV